MMSQIQNIFVDDPVTGEVTVSMPFLGGLIRGIWSRYDADNSGFLTRNEFKRFFEELFEGAGMGNADLVDWYLLEQIYKQVDITKDGNISRLEMQKFLQDLFVQVAEHYREVKDET